MIRRRATVYLVAAMFCAAGLFSIFRSQSGAQKIDVQVRPKNEVATKQGKAPTTGKQPAISIEANQFDAGEVWEGDIVTHSFVVKNTGKAELTIANVKPG